MELLELRKMSVPQLREKAEQMGIQFAIRWSKPKLIKEIQAAEIKPEKESSNDYSEFLSDNGQETPQAETPTADNAEKPQDVQPPRGGQREGAGRPEGSTEAMVRLKKAMAVKVPDLNIREAVKWLSSLGKAKKPAADKIIDKVALYSTKAAEYIGIMEKIRNTPLFIFGGLIWYSIQVINHLRGKSEQGENNSDIRQAGNGQEQSGKELSPAV